MASDNVNFNCCVTIEWLTKEGIARKTVKLKTATIQLLRNEFREMFILVRSRDASHKFLLKGVAIHKKFMQEGKATIKFSESNVNLFISNAPTMDLVQFLKLLFVKLASSEKSPKVTLREKLVSQTSKSVLQDISPVNRKDVNRVNEKITSEKPTSRKRGLFPPNKKACLTSMGPSLSQLNPEQKYVLEAVKKGSNIFFTGSAGTGKSFLLRCILNSLPPDSTVATASTGAAACLIGGVTLHSFAGIGTGEGTLERCRELASRKHISQGWRQCKHLIIDEISMVDGPYFEKIEYIAREIRGNDNPFGGIQVIVCGDFLQLPPVTKSDIKFCFMSQAWEQCTFQNFNLKQVHRQSDPTFVDMLNKIRVGKVPPEVAEMLSKTSSQNIEKSGILATRLCCHTKEAKIINDSKLNQLLGDEKVFEASDNSSTASKILDECTPVEKRITLKEGAQVMLLKNVDITKGLVNGARGVIHQFANGAPVVKFLSGISYTVKHEKWSVKTGNGSTLTRTQVPLCLAWAFSIHKSQGLTLDCVEMSLEKTFEAGQAYVALSRAKSLHSLRVLGFNSKQVWANQDVLKFYKYLNCYVPTEYIKLGVRKLE
ncbi:hypothetical protein AAG570_003551 [Ranatra chinensis]|uniref:ATP-dependent DNA helicase PIF1 n=1 Tax=Ranatra chinensis TaxID=642074 RepID=A0ABD0Y3Z7_9HEMI